MPYVSLIIPTMRVGGLDILFDSLKAQEFTDFELVLVDGLYERRKDIVSREAKDRFLAVRHVGITPNPFPNCAFCLYANAGIAASTGEVLLFMVDYSRLPPDLIRKHAEFHKADKTGRAGMMGPHRYIGLDTDGFPAYGHEPSGTDRYEEDVRSGRLNPFMLSIGRVVDEPAPPHLADGGAIVPHDADPKLRLPAGPVDACYFHAKNESVHRDRVLEIDGWDTDLDGAHLYQDSDFADRLSAKAGVKWTLDPTAVVDIANPRHVFPFARRSRPHEDNFKIWQAKKAAGYPPRRQKLHELHVREEKRTGQKVDKKPLRIAMIYGEFSSAIHGPFDIEGLYTKQGLTGSESSFFNLARTLAERGHEVAVFCRTESPVRHSSGFEAVPISALSALPQIHGLDAVIAWNEPDYLKFAPPGVKRYCDQQLNDWGYCRDNWQDLVDVLVFPSESSRVHHVRDEGVKKAETAKVIPNSVDLDLFAAPCPERSRKRVAWCSSPDRGLHHLIGIWPEVRKRVPDAELHVFYRLAPWLKANQLHPEETGNRARYIEAALPRLARFGVRVHDSVPNVRMARELQASAVLAYPCDPVRYTEGFGCSVLDATAAGCVAIVSDADALPSVHGNAVMVVPGNPGQKRVLWTDTIVNALQLGEPPEEWKAKMRAHAERHSRQAIADEWEALLTS